MNTKIAGNPDLLSAGSDQVAVSKLVAITPPQGNNQQKEIKYFHCSMPQASFHRKDGKKLPFLNHFFKTDIVQDIEYLMNEIENGNQYLRLATAEEVGQVKMIEDPINTIREKVKGELSIEDLEKLLAERRATQTPGTTDAQRIGGVDKQPSGVVQAQGVANHAPTHAAHTGATTASLSGLIKK